MLEVKGTAEDGTEFELTESEVNAARRNRRRDAYRIIFVRHVFDPARTLPLLIPNPFSQRGADTYGAPRSAPTPPRAGVEQAQELPALARRMSLYGNLIPPCRRDARSSACRCGACRAV